MSVTFRASRDSEYSYIHCRRENVQRKSYYFVPCLLTDLFRQAGSVGLKLAINLAGSECMQKVAEACPISCMNETNQTKRYIDNSTQLPGYALLTYA